MNMIYIAKDDLVALCSMLFDLRIDFDLYVENSHALDDLVDHPHPQ